MVKRYELNDEGASMIVSALLLGVLTFTSYAYSFNGDSQYSFNNSTYSTKKVQNCDLSCLRGIKGLEGRLG